MFTVMLNLVVVDYVCKVQGASEFSASMELLYLFISSTKVHDLFLKKQAELYLDTKTCQLQQLSDTRWPCRYYAVDAICCTYDCVIASGIASLILMPGHRFFTQNVTTCRL